MPSAYKRTGFVRTVLGDIDTGSLGHCQCHEHLFIEQGTPSEINPALCMEDPEKALSELALYKNAGGQSLVDAQPIGCGRMSSALRDASARSGVHIVASTGFHKLVFYPEGHWIYDFTEDELASVFIREIKSGFVDDSGGRPGECRAGIIKAALDACGITRRYATLLRAAAAAARETGAALLLHVEAGADPAKALRFFTLQGLSPESLIFCHLDRANPDVGLHIQIAQAGAYLEYDTIGRFKYHSDEHEIGLMERIVAAGLESRLLMSLDTTRERLKSYGGTIGLDYIRTVFLPMLAARGMGKELIRKITIDNPAAALSIQCDMF